ncbi:coiled-coil domain-containing protein 191 [Battus philenor]|uniref:coiled-coil domain-containing protein 191 n=1 Tax=Battus philenor TaxID=42288 RepID=UPI0035CEBD8C
MQVKQLHSSNSLKNKIKAKKYRPDFYSNIDVVEDCEKVEFNKKKKITLEILEPRSSHTKQNVNNDFDFNFNIKTQINKQEGSDGLNEFRTDLQLLLTNIAINSKTHDNDDSIDKCDGKKVRSTCNDDKQVIATFEENKSKISELFIMPLRINAQKSRNNYLAKKYTIKWKMYVDKNRLIKKRETMVNKFLDKLEEKKNISAQCSEPVKKTKIYIRDYNTYQHRYKVQQNIIALQKMKLEEQTKIIEQLKYNKIIESSKQSLEAMREEVSKTYYQIDPQLKPKIKCLTTELKIKELEEPQLVLHCLKVPQFIQRMEKRAREREEKHALIRERRRQMEEERMRLKQQSELAKAEMDKDEKLQRIKELKEKRKKEKIENIRKKQYAERMRALVVMADIHYEKNLMTKYGINPLKRLITIKRDNEEKAKSHYLFQIKKNVFFHWMWHTEDMWFERNYKAEEFYRTKILSKAFNSLKKNYEEYKLKLQVAEDYYDLYLTQLALRNFRKGIEIIRREFEIKWNKSILYYNSTLLFKTFTCWRSLPALNALRREQEARKLRWREKVLQVVPDYKPPNE